MMEFLDLYADANPLVNPMYSPMTSNRLQLNGQAFVEIAPGKEGLVHISKLDVKRVEKVEDVVAVGDQVIVKVTEIDDQGRINLSRRDALVEINGAVVEDGADEDKKPRKDRKGFRKH